MTNEIATADDLRTVAQHWQGMAEKMGHKNGALHHATAQRVFALADAMERVAQNSRMQDAIVALDADMAEAKARPTGADTAIVFIPDLEIALNAIALVWPSLRQEGT